MNTKLSLPPAKHEPPSRTYPVLSADEIRRIIEAQCGRVRVAETHGSGEHTVFILPEPFQELRAIVSYGRRSPMNLREQKLAALGHFLTDGKGRVCVVVTHFLEIHTTNRTACSASNLGPHGEPNPGLDFLEYYRAEFLEHEADRGTDAYGFPVDPFLERCGPSEFVMECHTHPDLSCFFSARDKAGGRARAASQPTCIFVCDPIRKEMLGAIGAQFAPARILVYDRLTEIAPAPETHCAPESEPAPAAVTPPHAGEIARLAAQCLRERGCSGFVRMRSKRGGKVGVTIRMVCPQHEDGG